MSPKEPHPIILSMAGRPEEALAVTREAVEVYRGLAKVRPDAFLPALARSLGLLGDVHQGANRYRESLDTFIEGLTLVRPFFEDLPQTFKDLISALARGARRASQDGRRPLPEPIVSLIAQVLDRVTTA